MQKKIATLANFLQSLHFSHSVVTHYKVKGMLFVWLKHMHVAALSSSIYNQTLFYYYTKHLEVQHEK